jgi:prohibitin 2
MNQIKAFGQKFAQAVPKGGAGGEGAPQGGGGAITSLLLLGLGAYGLSTAIKTVQPGHKGVVYNRFGGINETVVLIEGMNFIVPWFQRAIIYDVRTRAQQVDTHSGSKGP